MYLPEFLPLPWRLVGALERARLALPVGRAGEMPAGAAPAAVGPTLTIAALGDVYLERAPPADATCPFGDLARRLSAADIACCNLEAPIASKAPDASALGSGVRAAPGTAAVLRAAGIRVVNVAGNHALDCGIAGFSQSLARLGEEGIEACGVAAAGGGSQLLEYGIRDLRVGFLGYADDHAPMDVPVAAPDTESGPALAVPGDMLENVASAVGRVDILIVQLHWGYEFRLHPLRRHRDLARRLVERGAHLVLCHHAHVPMGVERWGDGLIAYGLGNAIFPMSAYMRDGHAWSDRSVVLEAQVSRRGVNAFRLVPFRLDGDGLPQLAGGVTARTLLRGVAIASRRLTDEAFMAGSERVQLAYEAVRLLGALSAARAAGPEALEARVRTLLLPRQQALIEWLEALPGTGAMAGALRGLPAEMVARNDPGSDYDTRLGTLESGLPALGRAYRWQTALAARVP